MLQTLIGLGLRVMPGREGNDAVDGEGNEYELKTLNVSLGVSRGVTTHHHLNLGILAKYRAVRAWYIALYEGITLQRIYWPTPTELEPVFQVWPAREGGYLEGQAGRAAEQVIEQRTVESQVLWERAELGRDHLNPQRRV